MLDYTDEANSYLYQHTLKESFTVMGRGLHTGIKTIMSVLPGEPDTGYVFVRRDIHPSRAKIVARWNTVVDTKLCTTVGNSLGVRVSTVEHLLAALYACGVDNAHIVLDGPEVPIMDGSAKDFAFLIKKSGTRRQNQQRRAIVIRKKISARDGHKFVQLSPHRHTKLSIGIQFESKAIGTQYISMTLNREHFHRHIAQARTFGFSEHLDTLASLGYGKGGSIKNAILVDGDKVKNEEGLRFKDEFVRHKYLDAVGDLALAGARVIGHFTGVASGHQLNNAILHELMIDEEARVFTTVRNAYLNWSRLMYLPENDTVPFSYQN
ncbi:UDP-3-O-acyl-N-acetylglucosamine deacetylase [Teredinibacter sp. KSP-S5-2]|uniref:UDP-3-O-acyl-N-acetylglucosamine deacetylase n=1 Tax=Teredinibacter sp. KSP-S5-2 TaxID=3034506 RepID=UPI00293459FA|nr:UDP-3-O-acyl-N-acetylglucosamine deacetylase [Teredinibacter sp. KSP-S5-2]WNO07827.1 UDP-3-O-acyl-N-acetylglucosamine deacetylase [Teredinibacter sp. KSP-S5-2]